MRLINTQTQEITEFFHNIPPYAILSHTWEKEEVTFQEYILATGPEARRHTHIRQKAGFPKILGACQRARHDGLKYLWCDTNCIDKSSSAELSEAINSMYAWYRDSVVCYAFLADVDGRPGAFEKSRWFTRGWTLQELLAPKSVVFFDGRWRVLGDRKDLASAISKITRIHIGALHDRNTVPKCSIAQRMSWAADRQTSRQEDIAYSLLGIFDINMPLLYGEGNNAFIRLQQEIIRLSDDQSILCWASENVNNKLLTSALSPSPNGFRACGSIIRDPGIGRTPYSVTNLGVSLVVPFMHTFMEHIVLVGLNCSKELLRPRRSDSPHYRVSRSQVWIWLRVLDHNVYGRAHFPTSLTFLESLYLGGAKRSMRTIFIALVLSTSHQSTHPHFLNAPRMGVFESSAGFHINVGFGVIDAQTSIYKKGYLPGLFTAMILKERGISTMSHQIISDGRYSTILSMSWDHRGQPENWMHINIPDPAMETFKKMNVEMDWVSLLKQDQPPGDQHASRVAYLRALHKRIEAHCKPIWNEIGHMTAPHVTMDREALEDSHHFPEVVVNIVFQDIPRDECIEMILSRK
ncbi:HET-domain-containing protein [Nemania serpens]|nr:HET-domain-containing protein [Nemania serpens]